MRTQSVVSGWNHPLFSVKMPAAKPFYESSSISAAKTSTQPLQFGFGFQHLFDNQIWWAKRILAAGGLAGLALLGKCAIDAQHSDYHSREPLCSRTIPNEAAFNKLVRQHGGRDNIECTPRGITFLLQQPTGSP